MFFKHALVSTKHGKNHLSAYIINEGREMSAKKYEFPHGLCANHIIILTVIRELW